MQQPPNRLGGALSYFAEAYRFAFPQPPATKAEQRRMAYNLLDRMGEAGKYNSPETVDTAQAIRLACTSAWFYSGNKLIADRIAATDARPIIKKRVGDELRKQANHDFEKLLDRPNSLMTWEFIVRYTVSWLNLLGNAYIFVSTEAPGQGQPEELWPLPANAIVPVPKSIRLSKVTGKPIIDYAYTLDGKTTMLPGENVIHIRMANPFDYWMGLSPLTALMDAVRLDKYQSKYMQGFFGRDNAIPTAIISVPQETNEVDFEVIKEQIREQFGQGRRSAITRAGDLAVQTITQTLHEMEIVAARKFNREEINHVLGIPDGLVSGGTSGDSRLATEITFARNTTQPLLDLISSAMDSIISPYYGDAFRIASPSIIPQDRALELQEYQQYSADRTIIENRKERNLPPLDLVAIMEEINAIREAADLEPIDTPLDDIMVDLMMRIPVRLIPVFSSNTSALAGKTGLRPGQTDAGGNKILDPLEQAQQWMDMQNQAKADAAGGDPNADPGAEAGGSPAAAEDALNQNIQNTGKGQTTAPKKPADATGALTGAHFVASNAARSWNVAAIAAGRASELGRWKKIALKEAKEGRNPSERIFDTDVLPKSLANTINAQLHNADEVKIGIIFDTLTATLQEIEL